MPSAVREVEYELENDSQQLLIFWLLEITAGPREGPWSAVLRLHHRSPGWGAMGVDDGGMNAPTHRLSLRVLKSRAQRKFLRDLREPGFAFTLTPV